MDSNIEYEKKISEYNRNALLKLWRLIEAGTSDKDGWMPGRAFEYLILRAFQLDGAEVR
ncbi:hypothetical protein QUF72_17735 [Desulfobacterales bacterium HSG2]|nr:hypothetical protein [Desulfobacterales bacterium HSG2]